MIASSARVDLPFWLRLRGAQAARRRRLIPIFASPACLLSVTACVQTPPHAQLFANQPIFSPQAFFAGRTVGHGTLRVMFSRPSKVMVQGEGQGGMDGSLVLKQRVIEEGKPERSRVWHLRPSGGHSFTGTLSDANGPIVADVTGNRLHVRFTTTSHLHVEQWIYLQPDQATALNRMVIRKFGITVAALRETIRREQ